MSKVLLRPIRYCVVPGCERDAIARDLCWLHYQHARKHRGGEDCGVCLLHDSYVAINPYPETCQEEGCGRTHYAHGRCQAHYRAERRSRGLDPAH